MNNTYNVLPFYGDISQQFFRSSVCPNDICTFKLYSPENRLLPFQFYRVANADMTYTIHLVDACTEVDIDITAYINVADIAFVNDGTLDLFTYFGAIDLAPELDCGAYWLEVRFTATDTVYSEVFYVVDMGGFAGSIYRTTSTDLVKGMRRKTTTANDPRIIN